MQQSHGDDVYRVHWEGYTHRHGDRMAYYYHVLMIVHVGTVRLFWFIEYEQEMEDGTFDFYWWECHDYWDTMLVEGD